MLGSSGNASAGSGGAVEVSFSPPQPIMNVAREATANAVAAYFVYFFSILLFGFSLTGSINRPRRRSDRATGGIFSTKDGLLTILFLRIFHGSSVRGISRLHAISIVLDPNGAFGANLSASSDSSSFAIAKAMAPRKSSASFWRYLDRGGTSFSVISRDKPTGVCQGHASPFITGIYLIMSE